MATRLTAMRLTADTNAWKIKTLLLTLLPSHDGITQPETSRIHFDLMYESIIIKYTLITYLSDHFSVVDKNWPDWLLSDLTKLILSQPHLPFLHFQIIWNCLHHLYLSIIIIIIIIFSNLYVNFQYDTCARCLFVLVALYPVP